MAQLVYAIVGVDQVGDGTAKGLKIALIGTRAS